MNITKLALASIAVTATALTGNVAVFAKGGTSSGTGVLPTTSGPCVYEWITDGGHVLYPLTNDKYPGIVSVDMTWTENTAPKVNNICLDAGWTVEGKQVTDGVQLRFNYQGVRAIDFKFVLGKTDIRNY